MASSIEMFSSSSIIYPPNPMFSINGCEIEDCGCESSGDDRSGVDRVQGKVCINLKGEKIEGIKTRLQ
jgi:hypothetical protein